MARAGIWYTNHIRMEDAAIEAPKNFRRCKDLILKDVTFANAAETLWSCSDVTMENVTAKGDYFAMDSENLTVSGLTLYGNYSFNDVKNMEFKNSRLLSKGAFRNSENVTVRDSFISGNIWAGTLTLINCAVESLQGMCYIEKLTMKNYRLLNTTLAFEYSTEDAGIEGTINSVLTPSGGTIRADRIEKLIVEPDKVDPAKTKILCREGTAE